jgi:hypothetical protein
MGKKDGGQRTKGNAKPSSSARSAELLLQSNPFATVGDTDFGSSVAPIFGLTALSPEEEALIPSQVKFKRRSFAVLSTFESKLKKT